MTYVNERAKYIEQLLVTEFRLDGLTVEDREGHWLAYVPGEKVDGIREFIGVDLTLLGVRIESELRK